MDSIPSDIRMIILCYLNYITDQKLVGFLDLEFKRIKSRWIKESIVEHKQYESEYDEDDWNDIWTLNGVIHRDDGPAYVSKYKSTWYQYGKKDRIDGPAEVSRYGHEIWYRNGKLHRANGPAFSIVSQSNGKIKPMTYYIHGTLIDKRK